MVVFACWSSVDVSPWNSPTHPRNLLDDSPLDPSVVDRSSPSGSIGNGELARALDCTYSICLLMYSAVHVVYCVYCSVQQLFCLLVLRYLWYVYFTPLVYKHDFYENVILLIH